jgi:cell division protein FtsQ
VSRQLPDTLVVDVSSARRGRSCAGDKLTLIDAGGHRLEPISETRAQGKLILSGEGGGPGGRSFRAARCRACSAPQVAEAEWVGHRRWNLTFKTGQVLALPEGIASAPMR